MATSLTSTGITFPDATSQTSAVNDVSDLGLTATTTELNYTDGVTSNIQTQFNTITANDWVTNARIATNAVNADSIAAGAVGSSEIAANAVGASELNVPGNGTSGQLLKSDGDGTFSWVDAPSGGDGAHNILGGTGSVTSTGNRVVISGVGGGGGGVIRNGGSGQGGGSGYGVEWGVFTCTKGATLTCNQIGSGGGGSNADGQNGNPTNYSGAASIQLGGGEGGQWNTNNGAFQGNLESGTLNEYFVAGSSAHAGPSRIIQTFTETYGQGGFSGPNSERGGSSGFALVHGFFDQP